MEGAPRLPMLRLDMKDNHVHDYADWMDTSEISCEELQKQITEEIKKHISEQYSDDPKKYGDCIQNLMDLQTNAYKAIGNLDFEGCNTLKKYYGQLHYMQSRFTFSGENALNIPFVWSDAFTGVYNQHNTFVFEQVAILYNIGACHSYLGAIDNRTSEEGTRFSCVHFQHAAGFFQYLADHLDTTLSLETSQFMLKLYINTMLGQGQECFLEKSIQDNRKDNLVAKISQQVVDYYKTSASSLGNSEAETCMGSSARKSWSKLITFKIAYYSAITRFYLGCSSWDQDKYGEAVAYLATALDFHQEASKLCKGFKSEIRGRVEDTLKYTMDVIGGKFNSVKKDNEFVYHDRVPDKATLSDAKGASLVKSTVFEPATPSVTGPDIFAKLVPMEAHLAASTYSEEKAKLLRSVLNDVKEKDEILVQFKGAIQLDPEKLIQVEEEDKLDSSLIEHCAELSVDQTSIKKLTNAMKELSDRFMDVDSVLHDTLDIIEEEESQSQKVKDICGKTIESPEVIEEIKNALEKFREIHSKTQERNSNLHTAISLHIANLKLVSVGLDSIKKFCDCKKMTTLLNDTDYEDISLVKKLCNKVKEMEDQRQSLVTQLRTQLEEDDVTSALMTKHGVDAEDLFKDELKKHDSTIEYIKLNLEAQTKILDGVTEVNVRYSKIRKLVDAHKEKVRTKMNQLLDSCTGYQTPLDRCEEAIHFFRDLQEKVNLELEKATILHDKNLKLRKKLIAKHEAKKPPARPSAPKPKQTTKADPKIPAVPGLGLSASELSALAGDVNDEFNDPEFLRYLQKTSGLTPGALPTNLPPSTGALPPSVTMGPTYPSPHDQAHQPPMSAVRARMNQQRPPASQQHQLPHHPTPPPQNLPISQPASYQPQGPMSPSQVVPMSMPQHQPVNPPPPQGTMPPGQPVPFSHGYQPSTNQLPPNQQVSSSMYQPLPHNVQSVPSLSTDTQREIPYTQHAGQHNQLPQQSLQQRHHQYQQPDFQHQPMSQPHHHQRQIQVGQNHNSQQQQFYEPNPQHHVVHQAPKVPPPSYQLVNQPSTAVPTSYQQAPVNHPNVQGVVQSYPPGQRISQPLHSYVEHPQPTVVLPGQQQQYPQTMSPGSGGNQHHGITATAYHGVHGQPGHGVRPITTPVAQHTSQPINAYGNNQINPNQNVYPVVSSPMSQSNYQQQKPSYHTQNQFSHGQEPTPQQQFNPNQTHQPAITIQRAGVPQQHHGNMYATGTTQGAYSPRPNVSVSQGPYHPPVTNPINSAPPQVRPSGHNQPQMASYGQGTYQQTPSQTPITQTNPGQLPNAMVQPRQRFQGPQQQVQRPPTQIRAPFANQPATQRPLHPGQQVPLRPVQDTVNSKLPQGMVPNNYQPRLASNKQQPQGMNQVQHRSAQSVSQTQQIPVQGMVSNQQQQPVQGVRQNQHQPAIPMPQQPLQPSLRGAGPVQPSQQINQPHHGVQLPANAAPPNQQAMQPSTVNPGAQPARPIQPTQQPVPQTVNQPTNLTSSNHARIPASQPPLHDAQTTGPRQPQKPAYQSNTGGKPPTPPTAIAQPLKPTVVGAKNVVPVLEPVKPSADLAGLTYTPQPILQPSVSSTSADELLSASPENPITGLPAQNNPMLVPVIVDDQEETMIVRRFEGVPYKGEADIMKLKADTEAYQKMVSSLLNKQPGSLCQLDKDWKQLSDMQEKHARQLSTAIGRCSSYKNRFQDILPFDQSRIVLKETKDDYINASLVDGISPFCPRFIATQSPLPSSSSDFWTMVFEHQVTLIVMLVSKNDVPKKCAKYWPDDRNIPQKHGSLHVTFTTSRVHGSYIERTFTLKHEKSSLPRSLTQLQYTAWPEHGLPVSTPDLLSFMRVVGSFHVQQRNLQWPIVVHCEDGVGHTGTFCATYTCVQELEAGQDIPPVLDVVGKMRRRRKYMLQEKAQLKFVYDLVYLHAADLLRQRGVEIERRSSQTPTPAQVASPSHRKDGSNFDVFGSGALSTIRASVEKMTVKSGDKNPTPPTTTPTTPNNLPIAAAPPATYNNIDTISTVQDIPLVPAAPNSVTDIATLIGNNMSDLVQGTMTLPSPVHTPNVPENQPTNNDTPSSIQPDLVSSCNDDSRTGVKPQGEAPVAPEPTRPGDSLLLQLTPEAFTLGSPDAKERQRITKADFFKPTGAGGGLGAKTDASDPFGDLDPLWGLKK